MHSGQLKASRIVRNKQVLTRGFNHRQGAQGTYDEASNAEKENEFGTKVDDEVIEKILVSGTLQESAVSSDRLDRPQPTSILFLTKLFFFVQQFPERQGPKNDSQGPLVAH